MPNGKKKDPRYKTIKLMLATPGGIKSFEDLFAVLPKTVVAKDMRTNNNRFYRLVLNPGDFTFNEVRQMASLIGCKYEILRALIEKAVL